MHLKANNERSMESEIIYTFYRKSNCITCIDTVCIIIIVVELNATHVRTFSLFSIFRSLQIFEKATRPSTHERLNWSQIAILFLGIDIFGQICRLIYGESTVSVGYNVSRKYKKYNHVAKKNRLISCRHSSIHTSGMCWREGIPFAT